MRAAAARLSALDLFEEPATRAVPAGRWKTRAFCVLLPLAIAVYAALFLLTEGQTATQHVLPLRSAADFFAAEAFSPTCPCTQSFVAADFEDVTLPDGVRVASIEKWGGGVTSVNFDSRQHFCRRAYELVVACEDKQDTCDGSNKTGANFIFVTEFLADVNYLCRLLVTSIETSVNAASSTPFSGVSLLTQRELATSNAIRRRQLASRLYYGTRPVAAEGARLAQQALPPVLNTAINAKFSDPPGCQCGPSALGRSETWQPCEVFVPEWSIFPDFPRLDCDMGEAVFYKLPVSDMFNGTFFLSILSMLNMSSGFVQAFGSGVMEPRAFVANASLAFGLSIMLPVIYEFALPDFGPVGNETGLGVVYDAPSILSPPDFERYFAACAPTTCTYVTWGMPTAYATLLVLLGASASLYNAVYYFVAYAPAALPGALQRAAAAPPPDGESARLLPATTRKRFEVEVASGGVD